MAQRGGVRPGSMEAVTAALDANRALVAELQTLEKSLASEETRLVAKAQAIRRRMALRRAQQAMDALLPRSPVNKVNFFENYEKKIVSKRQANGVVPRSYIRPQSSFFSDQKETKKPRGRPRKKQKKEGNQESREDAEVLRTISEPPPNADTKFLRTHSHEAFVATTGLTFTPKERQVLKDFAEDYCSTNGAGEVPLEAWNQIQAWQKARSEKQKPLERTGFACKLWYELHEAPQLRRCAWTKQEDAALVRLATGQEDPALVNKWHEIAKRMPVPGRPAVHCLIRYQTALCGDNVRSSFTPEEDNKLREAVRVFGEKWNVIADLLDGRLPEQLRHRWQLSLAPGLRQGKFSVVEDRRLLLALRAYLPKDSEFSRENVAWNDVGHHIPGRTQPSARDRFQNSLNPELSFRKWTKQEDATILSRVKEWGIDASGLWTRLSAELGDRTDSQVVRRWRSLDPEAFKQRREVLQQTNKHQTTSVFRRRCIHRRSAQAKTEHAKRSSYNGRDSRDEEVSQSEEEGTEILQPSSLPLDPPHEVNEAQDGIPQTVRELEPEIGSSTVV